MHDHQLDVTHYVAAILGIDCIHPELVESRASLPDSGMMYQCTRCKKKIIIPDSTLVAPLDVEEVKEVRMGILGLAFGEQWKRNAF